MTGAEATVGVVLEVRVAGRVRLEPLLLHDGQDPLDPIGDGNHLFFRERDELARARMIVEPADRLGLLGEVRESIGEAVSYGVRRPP